MDPIAIDPELIPVSPPQGLTNGSREAMMGCHQPSGGLETYTDAAKPTGG